MSTPAVTLTESAPVATVETPEITPQDRLNHASSAEYATWRKTGDLPPVKPAKEAASAPAEKPSSEAQPEKDGSAPSPKADAAASPAEPQKEARRKTKEDTERRFQELLGELKELKEFRRQVEEERKPKAEPSEKSASQPTAEKKARLKMTDVNPATGKKFETIEEWQDAREEQIRQEILAEVDGKQSKTQQERQQQEQTKILNEGLNRKFDEARKAHDDFDEQVFRPDLEIPVGSLAQAFLYDSDHAGEVAYYIATHPEVIEGWYEATERIKDGPDQGLAVKFKNLVPPMRQHRKLLEIEAMFSKPKPEPKPSAQREPVRLPKPPTELSARKSAPVDPEEAALSKGDFRSYKTAADARELAARRR